MGGSIMKKETFTFNDPQNEEIHVYKWFPEGEPKAIVQLAHGLVETADRYERFAEVLTKEGYGVYINDHRGHGKTAKVVENVGHMGRYGFSWMVRDMQILTQIIKRENPGLPVFLFAHSMGSFLAQEYVKNYGRELKGLVLSGTAGKTAGVAMGSLLAQMYKRVKGPKVKNKTIDKMAFGSFNKPFAPNRTQFDWLSRDEAEVDKYIANPFCGIVCTNSFYHSFYEGLNKLHDERTMRRVPKDLPIFIFVGDADPVGGKTVTVKWLIDKYKELGIKDVSYIFYKGGRHEMLNETNRDEVMQDTVNWLNSHM